MDKVSLLLGKVLRKRGLQDQAAASYAVYLANEWLCLHCAPIAKSIQAVSLTHSILLIESDHGIASQELTGRIEHLREYLNTLDGVCISEIRIMRSKESAI